MPRACVVLFVTLLLAAAAQAQVGAGACSATYLFDGNLTDSSGGGFDGEMVGLNGVAAVPGFTAGINGQALELDGSSVMRVLLDLHPEFCPQFTIAGWVRMDPTVTGTQWVVATGGAGPGLRTGGRGATLSGSGNGLREAEAIRDDRVWFFFAGVYDYTAQTYRFHWRERSVEGRLSDAVPGDVLWVGALNELLHYAVRSAAIDELRIIGRALTPEEVSRLRGSRPSAFVPAAADASARPSTGLPQAGPGFTDRIGQTEPIIDADDLADRRTTPPLIPGQQSSDTGNDIQLREAGIAADGPPPPTLTLPADDPGTELREQLDNLAENPPIETVDEIFCDVQVVPTLEIDDNADFPERFTNALNQLVQCGYHPQVVAINRADQWIVSGGDQIARSTNIPAALAQQLDAFESTHGALDAGDISNGDSWLIAAGNEFAQSGVSVRARFRARQVTEGGGRIVSFSFDPDRPTEWLMVDDGGSVYSESRIPEIERAVQEFPVSQIRPRLARYLTEDGWVLFGTDLWYVSNNLRSGHLGLINNPRNENRAIAQLLSYRAPGNYLRITMVPPARGGDPIWEVENGFDSNRNIWTRLAESEITGAAIAAVRNNTVVWSRGYGLRNVSDGESYVHPSTRFDFASVSKAVAAFALMQLTEDPDVALDIGATGGLEDIEALFSGDDLQDFRDNVQPQNGNIIQVMQHCGGFCYGHVTNCDAGFSQGGAREYDDTQIPPTTAEVILGNAPAANGNRIVRNGQIGQQSRYTSANYNLIQALIDVHGGGFVAHTDRLFRDLGMASSTYASPYIGRNTDRFARGHERGVITPTVAYGELAAASLVSTAADIARFVIAVNDGGGGALSSDGVDRLVGRNSDDLQYCSNMGTMRLGINRRAADGNWGTNETWWHNGDHNGYHAKMIGIPRLQSGLVAVMTSHGDDENDFWNELAESFRDAYGIR
ncbi:MAG: serine hydrolase [Pseudomonadales bacterium]